MNRILTSVTVFSLSVLPLVLGACTPNKQQVQENRHATQATQPLEIKLPPKFGVFYESAQGPMELGEKTTLPAVNPSFILYLEKVPEAAKLRFRFVKAAGGPFIADAGTVTSSDNDDPAKRHNDDHSVLCAKRDDNDRPVYVIVAKSK